MTVPVDRRSSLAWASLLVGGFSIVIVSYGRMTGFDPFFQWVVSSRLFAGALFFVYFLGACYCCALVARDLQVLTGDSWINTAMRGMSAAVGVAAIGLALSLFSSSQADKGEWVRFYLSPLSGVVGLALLIAYTASTRSSRGTEGVADSLSPRTALLAAVATFAFGILLYAGKSAIGLSVIVALQLATLASTTVVPVVVLLSGTGVLRPSGENTGFSGPGVACLGGALALAAFATGL